MNPLLQSLDPGREGVDLIKTELGLREGGLEGGGRWREREEGA